MASVAAVRFPEKKIRLIHSRDRVLNTMGKHTSLLATRWLLAHNVELLLNSKVTQICEKNITLESGEKLESDVTILVSGIKPNDKLHEEEITFSDSYKSLESEHILVCGDASSFGLYTTAHNAMLEGRRMGNMIADKIENITRTYQPLENWPYLALALGPYDGLFTTPKHCVPIPRFTGLAKWFIEQRVFIEFKYKIMLPV
ncbi:FAD-dependent oxidoreductase [Patescibacteria group bacterium]|nr:FAD-dependent oxidoreductase [Patescibacteria group bacterium]